MKKYFSVILFYLISSNLFAQISKQQMCGRRTFYSYTSFNQASVGHQLYANDVLDSMKIYWGDGTNYVQIGSATGAYSHQYPQATQNYLVTMELWGKDPINVADSFHCSFTDTVFVVNAVTADTCKIDWREEWNGNVLSISNTSHIFSTGYYAAKDSNGVSQSLWDFGNGAFGIFANRIHDVEYSPGKYTICHRVGGFSYNNNGYIYNCNECKQIYLFATELDEIVPLRFSIYPNPAKHFCEINSSQPLINAQVYVTDVFGHLLHPNIYGINNFTKRINTTSLNKGIYIITIVGNGTKINAKLVVE